MHSRVVMKHKGSISQTYLTRDGVVIPNLYKRARQVAEYPTTVMHLFEIAAELPVPQFYISDDAARSYIRKRFLHKKKVTFRTKYKQRLFDAFYDEVDSMMKESKYQEMGLMNTVVCALMRPAPCVGLTPLAILQKYFKKRPKRDQILVAP